MQIKKNWSADRYIYGKVEMTEDESGAKDE
jgi:hypothetical protein